MSTLRRLERDDAPPAHDGAGTEQPTRETPGWIRAVDRLSDVVGLVAAAALVLLAINIIVDVAGRTFLNEPFPGTLELTSYWWMPALALCGFAYAERKQQHIRVTVLVGALPAATARLVEIAVGLVSTVTLGALTVYTFYLADESTAEGLIAGGAVELPIWPAQVLAVVALAALTLQNLATTYRHFARIPVTELAEPADQFAGDGRRRTVVGLVLLLVVTAGSIVGMLFLDLSPQWVGVLAIALSVLLVLLGIPVGVALLASAVIGLADLGGFQVLASTLEHAAYGATSSWSLSVIPMFVLMGTLLWRSGLTGFAFASARLWLGRLPGGLAVATNFASAGLAAGSGSTIGISHAVGRLAIPEMLRAGYKPSLAAGTVAASGTLGQIIPPSIMLVIYAGVAAVPIGPQLLAGVVPGIILAVAFGAMIIIRCWLNPSLAPRAAATAPWAERFRSLVPVLPIAVVVFVVIGGIFLGIFTATESAAFGAVVALVCGYVYQTRVQGSWLAPMRMVTRSLLDTVAATAGIFVLLIGIEVLTRAIALSRIANDLATTIVDLGLGRVEVLLVLIVMYYVLAMFMDELAMMLLTVPVLAVPLELLGVDLIWFGVFMVVMAEIGLLAPPIGLLTFIVHRITEDPEVNLGRRISLTEVFKGVMPFVVVALLLAVLLIFVPDLATWLPSMGAAE